MSNDPPWGVVPVEPLLDWESPAINGPAPEDPKTPEGFLADPGGLVPAGVWVGVTVASGILGNTGYEEFKTKVVAFLAAWRDRHGDRKLDELKQQVFASVSREYPDPQQGTLLRQALEELFEQAAAKGLRGAQDPQAR
jgi:hypothetical protein